MSSGETPPLPFDADDPTAHPDAPHLARDLHGPGPTGHEPPPAEPGADADAAPRRGPDRLGPRPSLGSPAAEPGTGETGTGDPVVRAAPGAPPASAVRATLTRAASQLTDSRAAKKGKHARCRSSKKRLAVAPDGGVGLIDPTLSPTRATRDRMGRIWVDPTQAELDDAIAAGATEELVFPNRLPRDTAVRLAAEVFDNARSAKSLGARLVPLVAVLTDRPRDVVEALEARRAHLDDAATSLELPDPASAASLAAFLATHAPDEHDAVRLVALAPNLARLMRSAPALAEGFLDACDPYRIREVVGWRLRDLDVAPRLVCEFLLAASAGGTSPTALSRALQAATVELPAGSGDRRFALLEALAGSAIPPGALPGGLECLTLAEAGALAHLGVADLSRPRLRTLAGMLARGWALEPALERLEAVSTAELTGWEVVDDPPPARRSLATAAHDAGEDAVVRFLAARGGISWACARGVLDVLSSLSPEHAATLQASLTPAARGACQARPAPQLGERGCAPSALRVAALFGTQAADYQEIASSAGLSAREATEWLPEPGVLDRASADQLGRYVLHHLAGGADLDLLDAAAHHWEHLDAEQRRLKPSALARHLLGLCYGPAAATPLGHAAAGLGLDPEIVARASGQFALGASQLRWLPPGHRSAEGLSIEFLDRSSGEALFLGALTSCAQSVGRPGELRATHGHTQPGGGFLVLRDRTGEVLAQSWVWLDERGRGVCFDAVEIALTEDPSLPTRVRAAVTAAARWLCEEGHGRVSVGIGRGRLPMRDTTPDPDPLEGPAGLAATTQRRLATTVPELSLRPGTRGLVACFGGAYELHLTPSELAVERCSAIDSVRALPSATAEEVDSGRLGAARWLVSREVPVRFEHQLDEHLSELLPAWSRRPPVSLAGMLGGLAEILEGATPALTRDEAAAAVSADVAACVSERATHDALNGRLPPLSAGEVLAWSSTRRVPVTEKLFSPEEPSELRALEGRLRDLDEDAPWDDDEVIEDPLGPTPAASYEEVASALFGGATELRAAGVPLKLAYLLGTRGWSEDQVLAVWHSCAGEEWHLPAVMLATHRVDPATLQDLLATSLGLATAVELAIDARRR